MVCSHLSGNDQSLFSIRISFNGICALLLYWAALFESRSQYQIVVSNPFLSRSGKPLLAVELSHHVKSLIDGGVKRHTLFSPR